MSHEVDQVYVIFTKLFFQRSKRQRIDKDFLELIFQNASALVNFVKIGLTCSSNDQCQGTCTLLSTCLKPFSARYTAYCN